MNRVYIAELKVMHINRHTFVFLVFQGNILRKLYDAILYSLYNVHENIINCLYAKRKKKLENIVDLMGK